MRTAAADPSIAIDAAKLSQPAGCVVTISIGVESVMPDKFQTTADLVEAADSALYAAKRRGRNRVDANVPALVSTSELEPRIRYETPPLVA